MTHHGKDGIYPTSFHKQAVTCIVSANQENYSPIVPPAHVSMRKSCVITNGDRTQMQPTKGAWLMINWLIINCDQAEETKSSKYSWNYSNTPKSIDQVKVRDQVDKCGTGEGKVRQKTVDFIRAEARKADQEGEMELGLKRYEHRWARFIDWLEETQVSWIELVVGADSDIYPIVKAWV